MPHYFEYCQKLSHEKQVITKVNLLTTSDMESIHERDDEFMSDYDSVKSEKNMASLFF